MAGRLNVSNDWQDVRRKLRRLRLAGPRLKVELEGMDGFISVERFQSLTDPDKLLSLSFWRDEEAVAGWRARAGHRPAQSAGRNRSKHHQIKERHTPVAAKSAGARELV
jgi:heme-degrading monooxygenase HmoA